MTLDELRDEYYAARARTARKAKYAADDPGMPLDTCRYCGRFWKRWAGSKLDGHAKCLVDERFRFLMRTCTVNPQLTYEKIGDAIGVTISVVRCCRRADFYQPSWICRNGTRCCTATVF